MPQQVFPEKVRWEQRFEEQGGLSSKGGIIPTITPWEEAAFPAEVEQVEIPKWEEHGSAQTLEEGQCGQILRIFGLRVPGEALLGRQSRGPLVSLRNSVFM